MYVVWETILLLFPNFYLVEFLLAFLNCDSIRESYGVDIENTQTDGSNYNSDDDGKYEDSFINDDELQVSPGSPILGSKGIFWISR